MTLASNMGDAAIPTTGYLLSIWAALFVLTVLAIANLVLLRRIMRVELPGHVEALYRALRGAPPIPGPTQPASDLSRRPG